MDIASVKWDIQGKTVLLRNVLISVQVMGSVQMTTLVHVQKVGQDQTVPRNYVLTIVMKMVIVTKDNVFARMVIQGQTVYMKHVLRIVMDRADATQVDASVTMDSKAPTVPKELV